MIHTIQADFYRLFRSKGFWITELVLFCTHVNGGLLSELQDRSYPSVQVQTQKPNCQARDGMGYKPLLTPLAIAQT